MRLTQREIDTIKSAVHSNDAQAKVFLFGSRTNSNARGGDIDLLIESNKIKFDEKISILAQIKNIIGEQKIDIVISTNVEQDPDPFVKSIRDEIKQL